MCLLVNKELGPGTPKMAIFLFLLLGGTWVYVEVGVLGALLEHGQWTKRWYFHRPLFHHFLTQKLLSHRGMA